MEDESITQGLYALLEQLDIKHFTIILIVSFLDRYYKIVIKFNLHCIMKNYQM